MTTALIVPIISNKVALYKAKIVNNVVKVVMYYEPIRDIENKVSVRVYENTYAPMHYHGSIEMIYCLRGKIHISIGHETFSIKSNEIAFVPSYYPHSVQNFELTESVTFIVPKAYANKGGDSSHELRYLDLTNIDINKKILGFIMEAAAILERNGADSIIRGYVDLIFAYIAEYYKPADYVQTENGLVTGIIDFINLNIDKKITLSMLAETFGYSKYHFSKIFNKTFNCNLCGYLNSLRSQIAEEKYAEGKLKKTDAVLDSGYSYTSSFYKYRSRKIKK